MDVLQNKFEIETRIREVMMRKGENLLMIDWEGSNPIIRIEPKGRSTEEVKRILTEGLMEALKPIIQNAAQQAMLEGLKRISMRPFRR